MRAGDNGWKIEAAAAAIGAADGLLICAGAGMGVDSGLPDFRGRDGFWRAYPPLAKLGLAFEHIANPVWFRKDPGLAWGFYGHRRNLYTQTQPHSGFAILEKWTNAMPAGAFVFTSNVDGHFQKAGFDPARVVEAHGSLHWLQCAAPCHAATWDAGDAAIPLDEATLRATPRSRPARSAAASPVRTCSCSTIGTGWRSAMWRRRSGCWPGLAGSCGAARSSSWSNAAPVGRSRPCATCPIAFRRAERRP